MLLKERGILKGAMIFATTQAGKPYIASHPYSQASDQSFNFATEDAQP